MPPPGQRERQCPAVVRVTAQNTRLRLHDASWHEPGKPYTKIRGRRASREDAGSVCNSAGECIIPTTRRYLPLDPPYDVRYLRLPPDSRDKPGSGVRREDFEMRGTAPSGPTLRYGDITEVSSTEVEMALYPARTKRKVDQDGRAREGGFVPGNSVLTACRPFKYKWRDNPLCCDGPRLPYTSWRVYVDQAGRAFVAKRQNTGTTLAEAHMRVHVRPDDSQGLPQLEWRHIVCGSWDPELMVQVDATARVRRSHDAHEVNAKLDADNAYAFAGGKYLAVPVVSTKPLLACEEIVLFAPKPAPAPQAEPRAAQAKGPDPSRRYTMADLATQHMLAALIWACANTSQEDLQDFCRRCGRRGWCDDEDVATSSAKAVRYIHESDTFKAWKEANGQGTMTKGVGIQDQTRNTPQMRVRLAHFGRDEVSRPDCLLFCGKDCKGRDLQELRAHLEWMLRRRMKEANLAAESIDRWMADINEFTKQPNVNDFLARVFGRPLIIVDVASDYYASSGEE